MQLTAEQLVSAIPSNENVLFDTTLYTTGNINYNSNTGIITITRPGRYIIHWWLSTQASLSNVGASFALVSSDGEMRIAASPLKISEVYGFGIFTVESELKPLEVSLKNIAPQPFYFNQQAPLQGSLLVTEDIEIAEEAYGYVYTPVSQSAHVAQAGFDVAFLNNGPLKNITHMVETSEINILEDGDYEIYYTFVLAEPADIFISIAVNGIVAVSTTIPSLNQIGEHSNSAILTLNAGDVVTLRID
ncbi:BclA C-terminal domain-containing protein [Clostridium minihomine]|uniref:BclA C-terminal domain-containing protein n=1 Tax=Clostridium minihomine TaxID=2045012 RepID=UPI000C773552|nr:hypothetical protein [Clostridium minihomine]